MCITQEKKFFLNKLMSNRIAIIKLLLTDASQVVT